MYNYKMYSLARLYKISIHTTIPRDVYTVYTKDSICMYNYKMYSLARLYKISIHTTIPRDVYTVYTSKEVILNALSGI